MRRGPDVGQVRAAFRRMLAEHGNVFTCAQLGRMLGVSRQRIDQIADAEGVRLHKRRKPKPVRLSREERERWLSLERAERFWARVNKASESECWEWQGARHSSGYGVACLGGARYAHRAAFLLTHGFLPNGRRKGDKVVMHTCDNPACCNPAHLRLGTPADNMADRDAKGRAAWQRPGWGEYIRRRREAAKQRKAA